MERLGRRLREAREAKGSTLEEAEAATHIRAHFLESLEAGDFAAFDGGDVQVRGFLRIYARYLDLPPRDVLGRYNTEVHGEDYSAAKATENETAVEPSHPTDDLTAIRFRPRDIPVTSSLPRWMSVRTVIIVGVVLTILLAILALVTYLVNQPGDGSLLAPLTRSVPSGVAFASMTTPTSEPPTQQPPTAAPTKPTFPVSAKGDVTLTLRATEHVLVRVGRGSEVVFQELMAPDQSKMWTDDEMIVVTTGNGAALQVSVNGAALGPMCGRGEVCTRAWGPNGELPPP